MQVIQQIENKLSKFNNSPRRVILDTRKKCSNNSTCRIIISAVALGFAFCLSCAAGSHFAYAEIGSSDVDFSLSVDATPSLEIVLAGDGLTTSPTSLGLNIKPNIDGTPVFGYSDLDVTVATSNATGYYLNFSTTNADGSLTTTSSNTLSTLADSGTFTCTTATASTCSFTTNRWGYKLAQDDATSYIAAPGSDGTKIDEIYTITNGVTTNLRVGAKVDSSLTAGNYSTTMSFAATAHPTTYGIYYNAGAAGNSASGLPATQSGALNNASTTTVTLSSSTPTWTGHTFNKWCLGTVNSTAYTNDTCSGTEYSAGSNITFSIDGTVTATLNAMWNINSYSIKYGTVTGISSVTLDGQACTAAVSGTGCSKTLIYGKPYNISATASTGYSFSSFSATAGTFGSASTASTTYTPAAGAATITPNASANTYSITIKTATGISSVSLSGGNLTSACSTTSTSGTSCTLTYGQTYTLAAVASTGYTFSSWSNSASQGTIAGTTTASTTYTPGTAATTLTPSATANSYSITMGGDSGVSNFTVNGSTVSKGGSTNLTYGQTYTITINYANGYEAAATPLQKNSGEGTVSGTSFTVGAGTAMLYANSKSSKIYLQNLSYSTCTTTAQTAYDNRDEQAYTIQRLADGRCWMMTNLNLGATTLSTDLTSSNTNLSSTVTASTFNGWKKSSGTGTYTSAEFIPVSGTDSTSGTAYGTLYNYCAASAGTICTSSNSNNASYDLCPAGWRLPTSNTGGEFATLYGNASYNTNAKMRASVANGGAAFALAGYFYSSTPKDQGSGGYYWSSTRNSNTGMYDLYLDTSSVTPSNYINRGNGYSIRCILEERTIADVTYMQDVTATIFNNTAVGTTATLTDSRTPSTSYQVKMLSLGGTKTLWMMSNLKLPGGTTLTAQNSNVTADYTLPSDTGSSGWVNDYCKPYMASKNDEYYYNWPAATARTNSTSDTFSCSSDTSNSVGDICPKGWRLPVYSGEVDNSTWRSNLQANGSLTTTGDFFSGSQYEVGSYGYWWTSTRYNNGKARSLYSNGSTAYASYDYKYVGYSVRCMRTS